MPVPDPKHDLASLIRIMHENSAELKKTQEKVASLEAAVQALQNSRLESEQKREERKSH